MDDPTDCTAEAPSESRHGFTGTWTLRDRDYYRIFVSRKTRRNLITPDAWIGESRRGIANSTT